MANDSLKKQRIHVSTRQDSHSFAFGLGLAAHKSRYGHRSSWLDNLRTQLEASCTTLLGPVRAEVVLTGRPPFREAVAAD